MSVNYLEAVNYKEKNIANISIPARMPRTNPQIAPGMILLVTMKSISFSNLLFPIRSIFVLINFACLLTLPQDSP